MINQDKIFCHKKF